MENWISFKLSRRPRPFFFLSDEKITKHNVRPQDGPPLCENEGGAEVERGPAQIAQRKISQQIKKRNKKKETAPNDAHLMDGEVWRSWWASSEEL